jgi:UDP-N-acetylglucosamine 4-epimerase
MHQHIKGKRILVTGGAGFIGSHLAEQCLQHGASTVRILDNFSTGRRSNLKEFAHHPSLELVEGDIRDHDTCLRACDGVNIVLHHAALGSVPRSLEDPLTTHAVNADGFLNMLHAAREKNVDIFVYASSSSVYGDNEDLPKTEDKTGRPLSPYALTKSLNEAYAEVFWRCYGYGSVGLRYFNVFGPRQDPEGPYAAVIPRFITRCLRGEVLEIYGDGSIERDFTYIDNVLSAVFLSLSPQKPSGALVFNVGCGRSTTVRQLAELIHRISREESSLQELPAIEHKPPRPGDIQKSVASVERIQNILGYTPTVFIEEGLRRTWRWFRENR